MVARLQIQLNILWIGPASLPAGSSLNLETAGKSAAFAGFPEPLPQWKLSYGMDQDQLPVYIGMSDNQQKIESCLDQFDAVILFDQQPSHWMDCVDKLPMLFLNETGYNPNQPQLPNVTYLHIQQTSDVTQQIIDLWLNLCLTRKEYRQTIEQQEKALLQRDDARLGLAMLGEQLVQISEHDDQSYHLQERILALVSHEMRTPLNGIVGMSELLSETQLTEVQSEEIRLIHCSAVRLAHLVDKLLDYRKLTTSNMPVNEADFDLYQCIEQAVELMLPQAIGARLSLYDLIDRSTPKFVRGDSQIIGKILTSLISNAIKFTPAGQVVVHVSCLPVFGDCDYLEIKIQDTGIGIASEHLETIFQPFSQIEDYHTRMHEGLGIGLCMAGKMAAQLDGQITVQSQLGKGSIFSFKLPIKKVSKIIEHGPTLWQQLHNVHVLIWSDDTQLKSVLTRQLIAGGCVPIALNTDIELEAHLRDHHSESKHPNTLLLVDENNVRKLNQEWFASLMSHRCIPVACLMPFTDCLVESENKQPANEQQYEARIMYERLQMKLMQLIAKLLKPVTNDSHPCTTHKRASIDTGVPSS